LGVQMYIFKAFHQNRDRNFLLLLLSVVHKDFLQIPVTNFVRILGISIKL